MNNKNRKALCEICPKSTRKAPEQMCETKVLQICLFSPLFEFIISIAILCCFYRYTYVSALIPCIATLIPSHFSYFHPDSSHSHVDSPHPHSHLIPLFPTLIVLMSLILFPNSPFWLLQILCSFSNI